MNSKNSKRSDPHRLLLNFTEKINLKRKEKYSAWSNLSFTIHGKILENHIRTIYLNYQLQHVTKNLNYLMNHILY